MECDQQEVRVFLELFTGDGNKSEAEVSDESLSDRRE